MAADELKLFVMSNRFWHLSCLPRRAAIGPGCVKMFLDAQTIENQRQNRARTRNSGVLILC